eukprot:scaffold4.g4800.t1
MLHAREQAASSLCPSPSQVEVLMTSPLKDQFGRIASQSSESPVSIMGLRTESEGLSMEDSLGGLFAFHSEDSWRSPDSIHLSATDTAARGAGLAYAEATSLAHVFDSEDAEEPTPKRQRLSATGVAPSPFFPSFVASPAGAPLPAPSPLGGAPSSWRFVQVDQVAQAPLDAQATFSSLMCDFVAVAATQPVLPPVIVARPSAPAPGTLIPESELLPGYNSSQPSSPSKSPAVAPGVFRSPGSGRASPSVSPNKPGTPLRNAVRSPFVTRPTRLAFEAGAAAATAGAAPAGAPGAKCVCAEAGLEEARAAAASGEISEHTAICLAAAALQHCGGDATAAFFLLTHLGAPTR